MNVKESLMTAPVALIQIKFLIHLRGYNVIFMNSSRHSLVLGRSVSTRKPYLPQMILMAICKETVVTSMK